MHCSGIRPGQRSSAKQIDAWHRKLGWNGIGYHYVVRRNGTIEKGRPESVAGAHCREHNKHSIGVCYEGGLDAQGHPADTRTDAQKQALKKLLEELRAVLDGYGIIKEQYLEFYSHKAALALTGVIANSMKKNYSTIIENYRMIERIMAMQEYAIAVGYGGIDKVANGTFLWILKTSKPLIVYLYCAISKIKNRIMTYLHSK